MKNQTTVQHIKYDYWFSDLSSNEHYACQIYGISPF